MAHTTGGPELAVALIVVKALMLVAGGFVLYYATKAYRRTGDESLGYLAAGFGLVLFGSVLGGTAYELFGTSLAAGVVIESTFVLVGFLFIAYSLKR